jgi:hypothetical protein
VGPRRRGLAAAIARSTGVQVPPGTWLLVDGEDPEQARWSAALALACLVCAASNALAIARIVRKVR